jgi:hypothetical protein
MHAPIVIPMEDEIIHTAIHPYCDDETCPCHVASSDANGDRELSEAIADSVSKGEELYIQGELNPHEYSRSDCTPHSSLGEEISPA